MPVKQLMALNEEWGADRRPGARRRPSGTRSWRSGPTRSSRSASSPGVEQLVVVSNKLQNVPEHGIYNFDPGAYFGMYRPDTFWLSANRPRPSMIAFLVRRLITMVWTLVGISILVFIIIQLPPGDYLTTYIAEIQAQGERRRRTRRSRSCASSTASTSRSGSNISSGSPASCTAISAIRSSTTSRSPT